MLFFVLDSSGFHWLIRLSKTHAIRKKLETSATEESSSKEADDPGWDDLTNTVINKCSWTHPLSSFGALHESPYSERLHLRLRSVSHTLAQL